MGTVITVRTGADIGQISDPTAVVVAEEEPRADGTHFLCRHLERLPLGTPYPQVVDRVVEIQGNLEAKSRIVAAHADDKQGFRLELAVDATGIGLAVSDELKSRGLSPQSVFFTAGDKRSERTGDSVSIGKGWMVGRLQVLLQSGRIHLPDSAEADALVHELLNYEIKVNSNANMQSGAFRTGTHDDLVIALGLAVGADTPVPTFTVTRYGGKPRPGVEERRQRDLTRAGFRRGW